MPHRLVFTIVFGLWSPSARRISARETKDCTAPESVKPSTNAQSVSQNMKKPSDRLSPITDMRSVFHRLRAPTDHPAPGRRLAAAGCQGGEPRHAGFVAEVVDVRAHTVVGQEG